MSYEQLNRRINITYGYSQYYLFLCVFIFYTRMHSSRMRTGRSLTVFRSLQPGGVYLVPGGTWSGGVYLFPGGVPGPRGCTWSGGVYLVPGGTWSRGVYLVWGVYLVPGAGGCTWFWGVYLVPRGVYLVRGCTWSWGVGVYLVLGGVAGQVLPPPVNRMTNRCKNITLAKTSFRPVNIAVHILEIMKGEAAGFSLFFR